ncbi:MAG: hypothetical protein NC213_00230 [Acetobacter sp.]|nr:hypothetical protein [Bacteroides sp.]MCM1340152.1 hypothetical protein [Acetobacter sp.]MCM1432896.1 hypothetical protein [Clostridiales bacterium]
MGKSNKKNRAFFSAFICIIAVILTICTSFTFAKFAQTKNAGTVNIEITANAPVLYKDFVTKYNLKNNGTTKIVFDSFNNQKAALGLTDEDWKNNTNYVQEAKGAPASADNLRKGIKLFQVGDTAYILAKEDYPVTFPIDSSLMFDSCGNLTSIKFNTIDTSNVTNMKQMFCDCYSLKEVTSMEKRCS